MATGDNVSIQLDGQTRKAQLVNIPDGINVGEVSIEVADLVDGANQSIVNQTQIVRTSYQVGGIGPVLEGYALIRVNSSGVTSVINVLDKDGIAVPTGVIRPSPIAKNALTLASGSGVNSLVSITPVPATGGTRYLIHSIDLSYSGSGFASGSLTINTGTARTLIVTSPGLAPLRYPEGIECPVNGTFTISLSAGGAGIRGDLIVGYALKTEAF